MSYVSYLHFPLQTTFVYLETYTRPHCLSLCLVPIWIPNSNQEFLQVGRKGHGNTEREISHRIRGFSGQQPLRYCHVTTDNWRVNCISFIEVRLNIYTLCIFQHKQRGFGSFSFLHSPSFFKSNICTERTSWLKQEDWMWTAVRQSAWQREMRRQENTFWES